jgi:uncharacterized membrane protein
MKLTPILIAMLPALAVTASQAAVFQVVELGAAEGYKSSFAAAINNSNQSVGTNSNQFNFPVDINAVDYTNALITTNLTAAEIEEVKKGNVNAKALGVLLGYLKNNVAGYTVQRFADAFAVRLDSKQRVLLRQTSTVPTNYEYLVGINEQNQLLGYGTAPFTQQSFTPAATTAVPAPVAVKVWVPAPGYQLGVVVSQGQPHLLPPLYTDFGGGFSLPRDINNNGQVIGSGSIAVPETTQTTVKTLCDGKNEPVQLCYYRQAIAGTMYTSSALLWQLDANGKPGTPVKVGYLGDKNTGLPHNKTDYSSVNYYSQLQEINDQGVIVGSSVFTDSGDIRFSPLTYRDEVFTTMKAVHIVDNKVESFINQSEWESNNATGINNKNIIVGSARKLWYQGPDRFFVYDMAAKKLTFPTDLFNTANTIPEAINDNNIVVGSTEAFTTGSSTRRNVGFMYDIATDKFSDLNTLLPCDSGYSIVNAMGINDKNVIVATAVKAVDKRDIKGDIVKDSNGVVVKEEIAVAVQLNPVAGGVADNCSKPEDTNYERKGGAGGWLGLCLLPLLLLRRKMAKA